MKYKTTGEVRDLPRKHRSSRLTPQQEKFVDDEMANNDEFTAYQLKERLTDKWPYLRDISISTIKRCRKRLEWVATTPRYCQQIREANMVKRLEWCWKCIREGEYFKNIFSDESTVALDRHGKLTFRRLGQPRKLKPRPKHPAKIHVCTAISTRGAVVHHVYFCFLIS